MPVSQSICQFVQELAVVQNESSQSQSQSQLRNEVPALAHTSTQNVQNALAHTSTINVQNAPALAPTSTQNVQNALALAHTSTQNVQNVQDYSCLDPTSSSMQDLMNLIKDQSIIYWVPKKPPTITAKLFPIYHT